MRTEPATKRSIAFVDGQNLFHSARESFGYTYPNYDVLPLVTALCANAGWSLVQARFYTGVPDPSDDAFWHHFWTAKAAAMGRQGVVVYTRPLRYRSKTVPLGGGGTFTFRSGEEKGIDVRIALDVIGMAHEAAYDVAVLLSQDQDLSEVAREVRVVSRERSRWLKVVSAYPFSPTTRNRRGINHTDWVQIDRALYDSCIDGRDYRKKGP